MSLRTRAILATLLSTLACHAPQTPPLPRLWVFYGGETEPFCLSLSDDGSGRFYGSFAARNPIRWRYAPSTGRLDLTLLSHLTPDEYVALRDDVARGDLLAFDSTHATISFKVDRTRPRLEIFGWILKPAESLADWQKPYAVKGCPVLGNAGGA